jgi:hypothetical protein
VVPPTETAFARAVRRLGTEEFRSLVAATHAARPDATGVRREGAVVVVEGVGERLLVAAGGRLPWREPRPAGPVAGRIDAVVAQRPAPGLAARHDAAHHHPAALRDRLCYGLDRSAAARVCERHLGLALDGSDPAPGPAAQNRRRAAAVVAAVALAVVAVLGAVVAGPVGTGTGSGSGSGAASGVGAAGTTGATVTAAGPATPIPPPGVESPTATGASYPPGLGPSGLTDARALAQAHGAVAAERSYRLTVVSRRADAGAVEGRWLEAREVVRADEPTRYRYRANGTLLAGGSERVRSFTSYADGDHVYRRLTGTNGSRYVRETVERRAGGEGPFADRAEGYVERYLGGTSGPITRVSAPPVEGYLLTAEGPPTAFEGSVEGYTATALITDRGFVVELAVTYERSVNGSRRLSSFAMAYGPLRGAVEEPDWYGTAREATGANGTATATTSRPHPAGQ